MNFLAAFLRLVAGVFLLAGPLFLAGAGWAGYRRYAMLERWPQVDATVTECRITSRQETSTDSDHHTTTSTVYALELAFR